MPAMLTESGRYMRRKGSGWKAQCFTCHAAQVEGESYKEVWDKFRTFMSVLTLRSHQLWVCSTCLACYERGTLLTTRLDNFNRHLIQRETRQSNIV